MLHVVVMCDEAIFAGGYDPEIDYSNRTHGVGMARVEDPRSVPFVVAEVKSHALVRRIEVHNICKSLDVI